MASCRSHYQQLLSFTKLLASHVNSGRHEKALSLFQEIHKSFSLSLDPFIFPMTLKSCAAIHRPVLGAAIHCHVIKASIVNNTFVGCALVDMYGKCSGVSAARKAFDEIPERNVVVWNAMVSIYTHSKRVNEALELFGEMDVEPSASTFNSIIAGLVGLDEGSYKAIEFYRKMDEFGLKPNLITVLALLPACVGLASLNLIKEVHGYSIRNGVDPHPHFRSGLVESYGRCGCLVNASQVFSSMDDRDVVAWSSLISAYALHGEAKAALEIFTQMEAARVKPDWITFLAVLKACSHAGLADLALKYFVKMRKDYGLEANSDHYSCLVDVLGRAGRLDDAYDVIQDMPGKATAKAWGALLGGCRNYGEVELAEIAAKALFDVEPDNAANYVLLGKIYSSLGRHDEAQRLRREMIERGVKSAPGSSWVMHQD
uniref:Pentatricopeptide repeat-containing protein n=1 Tax=Kalanchoe fedtschenkoi TaxID=63787 RepID=A0A7N0T8C6_KALFE